MIDLQELRRLADLYLKQMSIINNSAGVEVEEFPWNIGKTVDSWIVSTGPSAMLELLNRLDAAERVCEAEKKLDALEQSEEWDDSGKRLSREGRAGGIRLRAAKTRAGAGWAGYSPASADRHLPQCALYR